MPRHYFDSRTEANEYRNLFRHAGIPASKIEGDKGGGYGVYKRKGSWWFDSEATEGELAVAGGIVRGRSTSDMEWLSRQYPEAYSRIMGRKTNPLVDVRTGGKGSASSDASEVIIEMRTTLSPDQLKALKKVHAVSGKSTGHKMGYPLGKQEAFKRAAQAQHTLGSDYVVFKSGSSYGFAPINWYDAAMENTERWANPANPSIGEWHAIIKVDGSWYSLMRGDTYKRTMSAASGAANQLGLYANTIKVVPGGEYRTMLDSGSVHPGPPHGVSGNSANPKVDSSGRIKKRLTVRTRAELWNDSQYSPLVLTAGDKVDAYWSPRTGKAQVYGFRYNLPYSNYFNPLIGGTVFANWPRDWHAVPEAENPAPEPYHGLLTEAGYAYSNERPETPYFRAASIYKSPDGTGFAVDAKGRWWHHGGGRGGLLESGRGAESLTTRLERYRKNPAPTDHNTHNLLEMAKRRAGIDPETVMPVAYAIAAADGSEHPRTAQVAEAVQYVHAAMQYGYSDPDGYLRDMAAGETEDTKDPRFGPPLQRRAQAIVDHLGRKSNPVTLFDALLFGAGSAIASELVRPHVRKAMGETPYQEVEQPQ